MYGHVLQRQFLLLHVGRIADDAVERAMQIRKLHYIVVGRTVEMHPAPQAAHQVVGQIVEHPVQAVAAQDDLLAGLSL